LEKDEIIIVRDITGSLAAKFYSDKNW